MTPPTIAKRGSLYFLEDICVIARVLSTKKYAIFMCIFVSCWYSPVFSQSVVLDACEAADAWKTFQSAGVVVAQQADAGAIGEALRFDVSFTKGSGYGGVFRNFNMPLPENYELSFLLRATVPANNFEVKVSSDSAGANIWWVNNRNFTYPTAWKRIHIKKRHLGFAWGPNPAPSPTTLSRLEIVVTAGSGGSGSVWIDDIQLTSIPPIPVPPPMPIVRASTSVGKSNLVAGLSSAKNGTWTSKTAGEEWYEVDYKYRREIGGIALNWDEKLKELSYDVLGSLDGSSYDTLRSIKSGKGGRVLLFTPEAELRFLRLALHGNSCHTPYRLQQIALMPSESLSTQNHYFEHLAAQSPRGLYPRYFLKQASYWTIVGAASDPKEALFNEDGVFEVDKQRFSVEPFIVLGKNRELLTWANSKSKQSLEQNYLPIPTVVRNYDSLALAVTLIASGETYHSALLAQYVLVNNSPRHQKGSFYLALRPFQVNPSYQWLNFEGGFARIDSLSIINNRANIDEKSVIVSGNPLTSATTMDEGEIAEHIATQTLSAQTHAVDGQGMASGAFEYPFDLAPADSFVVIAAVPFWQDADRWKMEAPTRKLFDQLHAEVKAKWEQTLNAVQFNVPPDAQRYVDVLRSNIAYVLINKDDAGFQPGSRSYERSWIRDGALTSSAMLKFGLVDEVKRFISWYAPYQYDNGMVPCVVDRRGPDPVPENDSHGELIFSCMEYFRFTADTAFLKARWPNIVAAMNYMQHLRAEQMTEEYRSGTPEQRACYGLLTESISHEGYSAKPMHSYWDDFFGLKGYKDAALAARIVGDKQRSHEYDSLMVAFQSDIYRSIALTMKNHSINYVPGCAELGDFDATSTTIALFPCGEMNGPLLSSYEKYFTWFQQRAAGTLQWDAFTPYEIRNVGSYVYLGQKKRAHEVLDWLLGNQRPPSWNDWAEVVWSDYRRAKFVGDMPHTWVGSDYINALRAMFVYEIDDEHALVVGGALKDDWVLQGLSVTALPTHYGPVSYSIVTTGSTVRMHIEGGVDASVTAVRIPESLLERPVKSATINGAAAIADHGFFRIPQLPADVVLAY